eukprot:12886583-Prorocentrum_lima.AAC.1
MIKSTKNFWTETKPYSQVSAETERVGQEKNDMRCELTGIPTEVRHTPLRITDRARMQAPVP